jgi:enamine deaminase RidA (YjgF/YER057c/UK114 family)
LTERIKVSTGSPWEPIVGYSRAIRVGNRVEVAGTTAMKDGQVIGENDAYAQTIHILRTLRRWWR